MASGKARSTAPPVSPEQLDAADTYPIVDPNAPTQATQATPVSEGGSNDFRLDPSLTPEEQAAELRMLADALAPPKPEPTTSLNGTVDLGQFGQVIGDAVARGMAANAPRRKVNFGEYDPKTYQQPDKTKTLKLNRDCFQNGAWMNPNSMFNEEIDLLNKITHSGRYINRMVEVILVPDGAVDQVHLRYANKTIAQRIELTKHFRDLADMLRQIVAAQEIERKEDELAGAARALRSARR